MILLGERLLCWEMDILERLSGECGTPLCMPATWKMLKKGFWGKLSFIRLVKKKNIFEDTSKLGDLDLSLNLGDSILFSTGTVPAARCFRFLCRAWKGKRLRLH